MDLHLRQIQLDQIDFYLDINEHNSLCLNPYKFHPKGCLNFGKNWSCPPYNARLDESKQTLQTYPYLWIIYFKYLILDNSLNKISKFYNQWKRKKTYYRQLATFTELLDYIVLNNKEWIVFYCSHCTYCQDMKNLKCNCPNEPCRFPEKIRISPQSLGIDIYSTLHNIHINIEKKPKNYIYFVSLLGTDEYIDISELYQEFLDYKRIESKFLSS